MDFTHYQILSVLETATEDEIKAAYRRLVKVAHTDSPTGGADSALFIAATLARDALLDLPQRRAYDASIHNQENVPPRQGPPNNEYSESDESHEVPPQKPPRASSEHRETYRAHESESEESHAQRVEDILSRFESRRPSASSPGHGLIYRYFASRSWVLFLTLMGWSWFTQLLNGTIIAVQYTKSGVSGSATVELLIAKALIVAFWLFPRSITKRIDSVVKRPFSSLVHKFGPGPKSGLTKTK